MTTHADLLAAIDKARRNPEEWEGWMYGGAGIAEAHNDYLDLCRVLLELHEPYAGVGSGCCQQGCTYNGWPCPTAQVVADALTRMGAL